LTEQTGDILITCTGGSYLTAGTAIPQANIVVQFNSTVTSRILTANVNGYPALDALLFIDDPLSGLTAPVPGWGPAAGQVLCSSPAYGCVQYVGRVNQAAGTVDPSGINVALNAADTYPASLTLGANVSTTNTFQALLTGQSQITFFGVPILPPGTTGITRTFRITNVRLNASALNSSFGQAVASISTNNYSALPITNSTPVVGYVQPGLGTVSVTNGGSPFAVCVGQSKALAATINIPENFGTAFKTRVVPQTVVGDANLLPGTVQNLASQLAPGMVFNSESGLIFQSLSGLGATAGLADFGTRLKLKVSNVPTGATVYLPALVKTSEASGSMYAAMVTSETVSDGVSFPAAGVLDVATTTYVALPSSGIAVYEILGANSSLVETLKVPVYLTYTKNAVAAPATATVAVSLAPNPTDGAFSATTGVFAQSYNAGYTIPRFLDTSVSKNLFVTQLCTTSLLYPYVTAAAGFDTGVAIANTTTDPFGTVAQAGTCSIYFYGSNAPAVNPYVTASVATGTTTAVLATNVAPDFTGYAIAVCNFQLAHGFAFVSDLGARNLAMGYLPLVMGNTDLSTARSITLGTANEFLGN
jgi:hypothetical protein